MARIPENATKMPYSYGKDFVLEWVGPSPRSAHGTVQTMMIMRYLFEYTLKTICEGNKSDFARRLQMDNAELHRLLRRFREGSGSIRATEALLEMYWREGRSLDEALKEYSLTLIEPFSGANGFCGELITMLHGVLEQEYRLADNLLRLFRTAEAFMIQLKRLIGCGPCEMHSQCMPDCPCKRFAEYATWLKREVHSKDPVLMLQDGASNKGNHAG